MSVDRFDDLDLQHMTEAERAAYERIAAPPRNRVSGPYRVWLRRPALAESIENLGRSLRFGGTLPAALRELAILATARHWGASYEWTAHEPHARSAGLDDAAIDAVRHRRRPEAAGAGALAVYDVCTELHTRHGLSDETFASAVAELGHDGVIELVALVGYYTMVAMTLNAFCVPLPDGVAPPFDDGPTKRFGFRSSSGS